MTTLLKSLPASQRSTLIVVGQEGDAAVQRAAGNLQGVKVIRAGYVNVQDVLKYERLVLTTEAVDAIHGLWSLNQE